MAVKLLVCELVMAGRSAERLGSLAELGAIRGMENREQVTVTQSHIKEIYTEHRGRTEGRRELRGDGFGFFRPQGSRGVL